MAVGRDKKNENNSPGSKETQRGPPPQSLFLRIGGAKRGSAIEPKTSKNLPTVFARPTWAASARPIWGSVADDDPKVSDTPSCLLVSLRHAYQAYSRLPDCTGP